MHVAARADDLLRACTPVVIPLTCFCPSLNTLSVLILSRTRNSVCIFYDSFLPYLQVVLETLASVFLGHVSRTLLHEQSKSSRIFKKEKEQVH